MDDLASIEPPYWKVTRACSSFSLCFSSFGDCIYNENNVLAYIAGTVSGESILSLGFDSSFILGPSAPRQPICDAYLCPLILKAAQKLKFMGRYSFHFQSNEQHDIEINSVRTAVEEDVAKDGEDALQHVESMDEQEQASISGIVEVVKTHTTTHETFQEDHSGQAVSIEERARDTFQNQYMDYEPCGSTPEKAKPEVPTKGTIKSLRFRIVTIPDVIVKLNTI